LARPAEVTGIGFVTGAAVRLRFCPSPPGAGIAFRRLDLVGQPVIAAHVAQVSSTTRRTTLGRPPVHVELVEHVLAALAGLRVDNCVIELDGPEPPGLDGSARAFTKAIRAAGIVLQNATRGVWSCSTPLSVRHGHATVTLHPCDAPRMRLSYLLDYGSFSPITPQRHTQDLTPETFCNGIDECRTFLLAEEAEILRKQGLGRRTKASDLLVFGPKGPIDNRLRFANEPARHKVLDLIGDLSLVGCDVAGHVVAYRSGHALNVALAQRLCEEITGRRAAA
jgi:UDP-3-O-acyl N-acetylglucosamine deacetylase